MELELDEPVESAAPRAPSLEEVALDAPPSTEPEVREDADEPVDGAAPRAPSLEEVALDAPPPPPDGLDDVALDGNASVDALTAELDALLAAPVGAPAGAATATAGTAAAPAAGARAGARAAAPPPEEASAAPPAAGRSAWVAFAVAGAHLSGPDGPSRLLSAAALSPFARRVEARDVVASLVASAPFAPGGDPPPEDADHPLTGWSSETLPVGDPARDASGRVALNATFRPARNPTSG